MSELLSIRDCTVQFGGLKAVSALNLTISQGELVGIIGPNGAGKTTVFNLITGVYQPTAGEILFEGRSVKGKRPYKITARGIARTFQNIRLFCSLTVFDNVRAAFNMHLSHGIAHALWRGPGFERDEKRIEGEVMELLEIFSLGNARDSMCKSLPLRRSAPTGNRASAGHQAKTPAPR